MLAVDISEQIFVFEHIRIFKLRIYKLGQIFLLFVVVGISDVGVIVFKMVFLIIGFAQKCGTIQLESGYIKIANKFTQI